MPLPPRQDQELEFEMPADSSGEPMSAEHLDSQVQKAQEAISHLKRQQDLIERQKRDLEELSRRQEQFQSGRQEMVEKLTRTIVVLGRETLEAKRRVEILEGIHASFATHLHNLEGINMKAWEGLDINRELTKAISIVDDARSEFNRAAPRITPEEHNEELEEAMGGHYRSEAGLASYDFAFWLKAGFAFTLPLFIVGVALIILMAFVGH